MSFGLYIVGFIVLIVGLAIGANMMHVPGAMDRGRRGHFDRCVPALV